MRTFFGKMKEYTKEKDLRSRKQDPIRRGVEEFPGRWERKMAQSAMGQYGEHLSVRTVQRKNPEANITRAVVMCQYT